MVLQKRLDHGFNGYQFPPVPRAARSARRRRSLTKILEENKVCAFDLLAIVAGNLLCETENASVSVKREQAEETVLKVESLDQETNGTSYSEPIQENHDAEVSQRSLNESHIGLAEEAFYAKAKNESEAFPCKLENDETQRSVKGEPSKSVKEHNVTSFSNAKASLCGDHIPYSNLFPSVWDDVKVVSRDDDENSSGCTYPSYTRKFLRPAPRIGDRRIRKILASKYWKAAPRYRNTTFFTNDADLKPVFHDRKKIHYRHQRKDRIYPFKKRKHFGFCSPSNSGGGISSELVSDSLSKANKGTSSGSSLNIHGATTTSSSVTGEQNACQTTDSHVKLRIRSFKVPELFIEIPESATVGSLKRTVMEAVTAILGGGVCIGVLVQGKKVRDDSKTLLQTGIARSNPLDSLGFSLEPSSSNTFPSLSCGDDTTPSLPACHTPKPLSSYCPTMGMAQVGIHASATSPEPQAVNMHIFVESDHDSTPSPPATILLDKCEEDLKALVPVPVPPMSVEALAMVAPPQKQKQRPEMGQRRIRRPFSVAEVEALVQAVEKHGTGRWRDVKLRAFDNAKHRTYVDLKDKWKTLVHTARISPQQRRGEPVPQELLDRVLCAHAYWSQQQAKNPQLKPIPSLQNSCLQATPSLPPVQALQRV